MSLDTWKVHKGDELTNNEYHAEQKHSSSSNLKDLITEKPNMFHKSGDAWGIEKYHSDKVLHNKKEQISKPAFDEGSLAHCLILEEHNLHNDFAIYPGIQKRGKEFQAFKTAEENGQKRTIVSKGQYNKVRGWVNAYEQNKTAVELMKGCDTEYSLFGELEGMNIKVRADAINIEKGYIADVKTTSYPADLENFRNTVKDFSYQLSGALYAKLFSVYYGRPFEFYFIVLGKRDRDCEVYRLGEASRAEGERKIDQAIKIYKQCQKTGIWTNKKNDTYEAKRKTYEDYEILDV